MKEYYIPISYTIFVIWLIISILFLTGFFIFIPITLYYYFLLKNCKYYYNDEKMIVETGIFNKKHKIIYLNLVLYIYEIKNKL